MSYKVHMLAFMNGEIRLVDLPLLAGDKIEDTLDLIFEYGQNDVQPKEFCSVSVGDVIELTDGLYYLVDSIGFKLLTQEQFDEHRASPRRFRGTFSNLVN